MLERATIVMPKLGLTMTEGLLASWRVTPGDDVREGDVLFVVETEKIATEVEATADGRIESVIVPEGAIAPVGATVATWSLPTAPSISPAIAATAPDRIGSEPLPKAGGSKEPLAKSRSRDPASRIIATPLARRVAREKGIDLATLTGTGPRGRVKVKDVLAAAQEGALSSAAEPSKPTIARPSRRPATTIEKVIARRLSEAKQTIPHFYIHADADVTRVLELRAELNADTNCPKLTVTHFVAAAVGRALLRMPEVDAVWDKDEIVSFAATDIGIAVNTDRGILVPVLRGVGTLRVDGVGAAATELVRRARDGKLAPGETEGGAVSISNVGMFGTSHLVPIINPGQSAILGVAAIRPAFRPDSDGRPALKQEIGLVLSCDHRVLDGVRAARFLDLIIRFLQQPLSLLRT